MGGRRVDHLLHRHSYCRWECNALELLVNLTDLPREVLLLAVLIHDLPKLLAHVVLFDRTVMVFERRQAYPREVECCAYKVGLVDLGTDIAHEN